MDSGTTPSNTPTPAAGRYHIDPTRTTVRFHTRHLFGLGGVSGTVNLREADLTVAEPLTLTTLHAVLDAASFDTGNPRRDDDVRSAKFLDASTYPDITFDGQTVSQRNGKWVVAGTVTAHGVPAPVDLTLDELHDNPEELTVRATTRVDRYAHQVTAGKGMAARWLTIEITAVATR